MGVYLCICRHVPLFCPVSQDPDCDCRFGGSPVGSCEVRAWRPFESRGRAVAFLYWSASGGKTGLPPFVSGEGIGQERRVKHGPHSRSFTRDNRQEHPPMPLREIPRQRRQQAMRRIIRRQSPTVVTVGKSHANARRGPPRTDRQVFRQDSGMDAQRSP